MDALSHGSPQPNLILPVGFWELLPRLQLLHVSLRHTTFVELPNRNHPLEWLIDIDPVTTAKQLVDAVGIWARHRDEGGPSKITLHGAYIGMVNLDDIGGEVGAVLQGLKQHGTVLIDSTGKPLSNVESESPLSSF